MIFLRDNIWIFYSKRSCWSLELEANIWIGFTCGCKILNLEVNITPQYYRITSQFKLLGGGGNFTNRDALGKDIVDFSCLECAFAVAILSKGLYKIFWISFMSYCDWTK